MVQGVLCLVFSCLIAGSAFAGPRDFVIEHAGAGGDQEQAQPYIQKFLEYVEQALGWPKGSASGAFFPEPSPEFQKYLDAKKPTIGLIDPDQYLTLRKKYDLKVIGTVVGKNQSHGHLNLLSKGGAYQTPDDLKGKTLVSNHVQSEAYLSRVVFDGKVGEVGKHFGKLEPASSMLKAVKAVDRGLADAALLSDEEVTALKAMAYPDVKVFWSSQVLPPMPVVAFGKNMNGPEAKKERDAFAKMLVGMCRDPKGAEVCKSLDITEFKGPEKAAYDAAVKRFDK